MDRAAMVGLRCTNRTAVVLRRCEVRERPVLHRGEAMVRRVASRRILGAAFRIHTTLGSGLLESAYEICLEHELPRRELLVERQKPLPVCYDDVLVDAGYRIDLLVEGTVLVGVKDPPRSPSDGSARPRRTFASLRLNAPFQAAAVPSTGSPSAFTRAGACRRTQRKGLARTALTYSMKPRRR